MDSGRDCASAGAAIDTRPNLVAGADVLRGDCTCTSAASTSLLAGCAEKALGDLGLCGNASGKVVARTADADRRPKRRGLTSRCCSSAATAGGGTVSDLAGIPFSNTRACSSWIWRRTSSYSSCLRFSGLDDVIRGGGGAMSLSDAW